jgi:hypothetical protein
VLSTNCAFPQGTIPSVDLICSSRHINECRRKRRVIQKTCGNPERDRQGEIAFKLERYRLIAWWPSEIKYQTVRVARAFSVSSGGSGVGGPE